MDESTRDDSTLHLSATEDARMEVGQFENSAQFHESRFGMAQSALSIEVRQMRLKVDVQPVCSAGARFICGAEDQGRSDSVAPRGFSNRRIKQERVLVAVPGEVDEADQILARIRADIREASLQNRSEVARSAATLSPRIGEQALQFRIRKSRIDFVLGLQF